MLPVFFGTGTSKGRGGEGQSAFLLFTPGIYQEKRTSFDALPDLGKLITSAVLLFAGFTARRDALKEFRFTSILPGFFRTGTSQSAEPQAKAKVRFSFSSDLPPGEMHLRNFALHQCCHDFSELNPAKVRFSWFHQFNLLVCCDFPYKLI